VALRVQFPARDIASPAAPCVYLGTNCDCSSRHEQTIGTGAKRKMAMIANEQGCTEQLARFFPTLPTVRIAVRVQSLRPGQSRRLQESTVVEFGGSEYAIFLSTLPMEFDERVRVTRDGNGHGAEAAVIALQYHEGRKAVAVRFLQGPCDWMQP
jgi:hypothetical protein